ncbi:WD40 repeat domain-containing protein [Paenibacillus xylaniclasticus]|uniref:WD40 repeat domain-containing protein n=1 Tax=Paenibacillus xylaniclasticus TaxID=588083 RepID=UPI000FD886E5|nr:MULTISPECIES: hypothetical protein [Paenibacillus]GFN31246.1 hypothetical protein PCURB6_15060 [Paenibacillus curdlanolyticus]
MRAIRSTLACSAVLVLGILLLLSGCTNEDRSRAGEEPEQDEQQKLTLIGENVVSVRWSPDGSKLAAVTTSGYLSIYEARDGTFEFARYADKKTGYINGRSLAWSADGNKIYYYDRPIDEITREPAPLEYGSVLMSADIVTGKVKLVHSHFIESVSSMDAAADGNKLYMNTYERQQYSLVTFQLQEGLHHDITQSLSVEPGGGSRLSRDGRLLFVNERQPEGDRYQGVIIELDSGEKRVISDQYLSNASFSPNSRWLAYIGDDHTVYVIPTNEQADAAAAIVRPEVGAVVVDWSPLGDRLALSAQEGEGGPMKLYLIDVPQPYRLDT